VQITIKNFQKKIPVYPKRIKKTILKILSKEGLKKSGAITVCFVNERKIRKLNLKYHNKNTPTDVLAFDLSDKEDLLADIVVSTDAAIQNAKSLKTTPFYEINLYVIHGILHLLGYDDKNNKNSLIMHKKEQYFLKHVYS
jgi:probable rRNA maturation factor